MAKSTSNPVVYMTLQHGTNHKVGTIQLELFMKEVPKTCCNFMALAKGHLNSSSGVKQGYKGSGFHRIIKGFMAQAGDYQNHNGTGGASIYGPSFPDENFHHSHLARGSLAMANSGPHTNGSQFYITFKATRHLDGRHVVFGRVREGHQESWRVLEWLEGVNTGREDKPLLKVGIVDCGVLDEEFDKDKDKEKEKSREYLRRKYLDKPAHEEEEEEEEEEQENQDEIDIDDEEDQDNTNDKTDDTNDADKNNTNKNDSLKDPSTSNIPDNTPQEENPPQKKLTPLQKRLQTLKLKMNQSRTLHRQQVLLEGERLGSSQGMARQRKQWHQEEKLNRERKRKEIHAKAHGGGDLVEKAMVEQGSEAQRQAFSKATKKTMNLFAVDDYYNPEGQHRNYERSLQSLHHPSNTNTINNNSTTATSSSGAERLAQEMQRRAQKSKARASKKREREEAEAAVAGKDVSHINPRNKRFNEKIGRNYDRYTAEIKQNLERGTAS